MTIPVVYGVHLKQATLLYLLSLPFVLVNERECSTCRKRNGAPRSMVSDR